MSVTIARNLILLTMSVINSLSFSLEHHICNTILQDINANFTNILEFTVYIQSIKETAINGITNPNLINITRSINKLYSLYILCTEACAGPGPSGLYPHVKNQLQQSVLCAVQLRTALPFYIAFTSQEQRPSTTVFSFLDFLMNFQISLLFS